MPAGYSGTPLPKKLGIKEGHTVALVDAPTHAVDILTPLPDGVTLRHGARGSNDVALVFCRRTADLRKRVEQLWRLAFPDRSVWVCWPKKSRRVGWRTSTSLERIHLPSCHRLEVRRQ